MRYAVISDVHGNLPALDMVLEDAEKNGIDGCIFAGDYCLSNPYPDECIRRLRERKNSIIVQGNEEQYLERLAGQDQSRWLDGQMQISYYGYRALSADNLEFLLSQPRKLRTTVNGVALHIAHSSREYIDGYEYSEWAPLEIARKYAKNEITKNSLRADIQRYYDTNTGFRQHILRLEKGVYIFGHSHVQWSWFSEDGKTLFINPGSCGLPLDGINGTAPYTILDISDDGKITVEEKRIPFDAEAYISVFEKSDQYLRANVWSKVIIRVLRTAREQIRCFLSFTEKYAQSINDDRRPFAKDTWEAAYRLWIDNGGDAPQ